jgi:selenocysteine-specific elongation factor
MTMSCQGDRVGICVTQFDAKLLERGLAASPGAVATIQAAIALVKKIKYFRSPIKQKTKFHVTVGHTTVMATPVFFSVEAEDTIPSEGGSGFDFGMEYLYQEELLPFREKKGRQWAFLRFDKPITCPPNSLVIASRLDTDIHANTCRLAFHGHVVGTLEGDDLSILKIYKRKQREGTIDRVLDSHTVIGKGLFKKQTDLQPFIGLKIRREPSGEEGRLESSFGKTGKYKVHFPGEVPLDTKAKLVLHYKMFIHSKDKKTIVQ